jgi:hypothetical protein
MSTKGTSRSSRRAPLTSEERAQRDAERRDKLEALHQEFTAQVAELVDGEQWRAMLAAQGRACRTALSGALGFKGHRRTRTAGVVQLLPKEIEDLLDHHNCRPAYEHTEFEVVAAYSGARDIGTPDVCGGRI